MSTWRDIKVGDEFTILPGLAYGPGGDTVPEQPVVLSDGLRARIGFGVTADRGYLEPVDRLDAAQHCRECGGEMTLDGSGVSNHLDVDGNVDYDADADHAAILDED